MKSSASRDLQRRQLDARLRMVSRIESPSGGWIRTIRQSLGMTMRQLGQRLGISAQSVLDLEQRERSETLSIAKLREAAEALNCELRIVLVPRPSLEETMRVQAALKARDEREQLMQTMRLESQGAGVEEILDESKAVERWINERARQLWD